MENLNIFTLVLVVSGGVICFLALRILWKRKIIAQLPILVVCLILLSGGGLVILSGLDLLSYETVPSNRPVAVLYFKRESGKLYTVRVKDYKGREYVRALKGNYWQFEARTLNLDKRLALDTPPMIRLEHFYVLNRTSADTVSFERSTKPLHDESTIDVWQLLKKIPALSRVISSQMSRTMKAPLEDLAVYTVSYTPLGLAAKKTSRATGSNNNFDLSKFD